MNIEELESAFNIGSPNEDVVLTDEEPASIIVGGKTIQGLGKGILSLRRNASIKFNIPIVPDDYVELMKLSSQVNSRSELSLLNSNTKISNGMLSSCSESCISWTPLEQPICALGNNDTEVDYISFHLFNCVDFFSHHSLKKETDNGGVYGVFVATLKWNDWEISIKALKNTSGNIKKLKQNGGYGLTHIGMVKKTAGVPFKISDWQVIRTGLSFFLSFAIGRKCWPNLCSGYNNNLKVYETWSVVVAPWSEVGTWWHGTSIACACSSTLEEFFPLFMDKWTDEKWKTALCESIHWFLNSNDSNKLMLEPALVLQQAAIERLSFEYVVNNKKLLLAEKFPARASDKFRKLFSSLGIRLDIHNSITDLYSMAKSRNWEDAPHAITEIRNSIVHPDHKQNGKSNDALVDAWRLSLEYLELAILGICEYKGTYQSRTQETQISVPWA